MVNVMLIKHITFDLDGTLIDSENLMKYSWENTTKELEIDLNKFRFNYTKERIWTLHKKSKILV